MDYFTFLNRRSDEYGIIINALPPIPTPKRNVEFIPVPGRDGSLTVDDETYDDFILPIGCTLDDEDLYTRATHIRAWLSGGQGELILSDNPNQKLIAQVVNKFDIVQALMTFGEFIIMFRCKPTVYSVKNDIFTLTSPTTIFNPGTATCKPIIKVYGTGDITLTINSKNIYLYNVSEYVTIDSYLMDVYKDTLLNNDMLGEFPNFEVGKNSISWTGTVTKLEIKPNWQYR